MNRVLPRNTFPWNTSELYLKLGVIRKENLVNVAGRQMIVKGHQKYKQMLLERKPARMPQRKVIRMDSNNLEPVAAKNYEIYTDGSGTGGWAFVVYLNGKEVDFQSGVLPPERAITNNRAELSAMTAALRYLYDNPNMTSDNGRVTIHADSKYVINGLLKLWGITTNLDLWEIAVDIFAKVRNRVHLAHVYGHSGVAGNERADHLAYQASKSQKGV
jgi:ribonuclease HI